MDESPNDMRSSFKLKVNKFCQTAVPVLRHVKEDFQDLLEETKKLKELKLLEETEITGVGKVRS